MSDKHCVGKVLTSLFLVDNGESELIFKAFSILFVQWKGSYLETVYEEGGGDKFLIILNICFLVCLLPFFLEIV